VARNLYWQAIIDVIANACPGFKAPSYEVLRTKMLFKETKAMEEILQQNIQDS